MILTPAGIGHGGKSLNKLPQPRFSLYISSQNFLKDTETSPGNHCPRIVLSEAKYTVIGAANSILVEKKCGSFNCKTLKFDTSMSLLSLQYFGGSASGYSIIRL